MGRHVIDLTGRKFGRLTVIERGQTSKAGMPRWICRCECGNVRLVQGEQLRCGHTKSCGCYARENTGNISRTHGQRYTKLYHVWDAMKQRCTNPNNSAWRYYGARGVKICDEWRNDFENFREWAMANGYEHGLTIDRIEVNGNYEPSNCRWITMKQQAINKRNNITITHNGTTKMLIEWADELGITCNTLYKRRKSGWSDSECITGKKEGGA